MEEPSFEKLPRKSWAHMSQKTSVGEYFSQQREAVRSPVEEGCPPPGRPYPEALSVPW